MREREVVIVGAGPYGLSAAAYLGHTGIEPYVIGQPMAFWKRNMPRKMLLRSRVEASNISAPQKHLSIFAYERATRQALSEPLPIEDFIAYGEWFQAQVCPGLDTRLVRNITHTGRHFELTVEDGEPIEARSVVLTLGIGAFAHRPKSFTAVPRELAPHSSDLSNPDELRGKRVAVVGRGQSALEYAALLHESGADVEIISRGGTVGFRPFAWRKHLFRKLTPGPLKPLSYTILPPTDLGDIRTARTMADPEKFRRQSPEVQAALLNDCTKPIGAYWLASRLNGVRVRTGVAVDRVEVLDGRLRLMLSDGTTDEFDRVVLATGYRIDISKFRILDSRLGAAIETTGDGYPVLTTGLQTSVPGLYMAGVIAERTLGPTLRFVTGTSNAGPRLAAAIAACVGRTA